jgi:hypothetical protein
LHDRVNDLFRESAELRAEGRYAESLAALQRAADLLNSFVADQAGAGTDTKEETALSGCEGGKRSGPGH